jgi:hypothetical protein
MTEAEEEKEFRAWKEANNQILDEMFSGKLSQTPEKVVEQYLKSIIKVSEDAPDRYLYAHSTLCKSIGNYFGLLDWEYGFEIPLGDLDSSYRFDMMAQKGARNIIVEVKPEITTRDLGQVIGYMFDVNKKFKKGRMFLGTDILNLPVVINGGEITEILVDNARHGLGVILADKEQAWLIPAEFLLI